MEELAINLKDNFPILNNHNLISEIEEKARLVEVEAGTTIMDIGGYVKLMPLVTKGAIKVLREDDDGNELFLYFLYPGQSCAMTVQCCMANAPSMVRAVTEDDTEFIAIPIDVLDKWMSKYNCWKDFILTTYSLRFSELLNTIDSIVFHKLDVRLMEYLREKANIAGGNIINTTHQDIAYDLHSSREVISRILKQLEKKGGIKLGRNKIELV